MVHGVVSRSPPGQFDGLALYAALDEQRAADGLSWPAVARELWDLSSKLNTVRDDHPISPATLTGIRQRGNTSCQHALFILRWLDRAPEEFMSGELTITGRALPAAGSDRRLRWHLHGRPGRPQDGLFEDMNAARRSQQLTWAELAQLVRATPSQLTGMRNTRFAVGMRLAMGITQWLERPAGEFIYPARW